MVECEPDSSMTEIFSGLLYLTTLTKDKKIIFGIIHISNPQMQRQNFKRGIFNIFQHQGAEKLFQ